MIGANSSLKHRALNSGSWVLSGHISSQCLRLLSNLILTRLLIPEMFGVMALVSVILMGVGLFSDIGLQQNIVQSKRADQKSYRDTAWSIQILRGMIIALVVILVSAVLSLLGEKGLLGSESAYSHEQLPALIAVMALVPFIKGFRSINWLVMNRKLMMRRIVIIEFLSQVVSLIVMIAIAWWTRSIWSLVLGGIVGAAVSTFLSHQSALGPRSSLGWDRSCVYEIIHFGKWILISSILGFLLSQGDKLLLGVWVTPELLGIYTIASFIATALKASVNKVTNSVFYPVLSEVARDKPQDLKRVYYDVRLKVDVVAMFMAGFLFSCGQVVIDVLYDARYEQAGEIFEILSLSMIFVGYSIAGSCLMAMGQVRATTVLIFIATCYLYLAVPLAFSLYGVQGAIIAIALTYIVDIPSTFYFMKKYQLIDWFKEFRAVPVFFIAYGLGQVFNSLMNI